MEDDAEHCSGPTVSVLKLHFCTAGLSRVREVGEQMFPQLVLLPSPPPAAPTQQALPSWVLVVELCFAGRKQVQMAVPPGGSGHSWGRTATSRVMSHCTAQFVSDSRKSLGFSLHVSTRLCVVAECRCRLKENSGCTHSHGGVFSCSEH